MTIEIRVPQLPESITDATLVGWHKQPGEAVSRDENLADLETDKVVLEVPAPANGVLRELKVESGATVTSGQLLAVLDERAAAGKSVAQPATVAPAQPTVQAAAQAVESQRGAGQSGTGEPAAVGEPGGSAASVPAAGSEPTAAAGAPPAASAAASAAKLSPSARRLIEENRLDAGAIPATGRDGRVTKADVIGFLDKRPAPGAAGSPEPASAAAVQPGPVAQPPPASQPTAAAQSAAAAQPAAAAQSSAAAQPVPAAAGQPIFPSARAPAAPLARPSGPRAGRAEQRVPMTRLRQRIAQRLIEAQSSQALLTTFNEVDLTAVQELRARYKDRFEKAEGVKLGFMSFFVKASIEALKRFPVVNASVDGTDIIYHEYYDIGVAVSTDRGLIVPIVRDADSKSFGEIEKEIAAYAAKARDGSIAIEDLTGGTFTVTNGGVFGSLMSTPIVNAPQSAILGMHKIQERPMVVNGAIAIRPMMYLALTYDHRIIDGREAVQFLVAVKDCLEDPGRMLLGV